jgi:exopolysaccharide production protein ExoZ
LRYRAIWMGLPALMICGGLVLAETDRAPGLITKALIFGGNISFALYLSHPFSMNLAALLFKKAHLNQPWLFILFGSTAAIAAAALFYLLVEKPVTKFLNSRLNRYLA